jgi:hypothetical protein
MDEQERQEIIDRAVAGEKVSAAKTQGAANMRSRMNESASDYDHEDPDIKDHEAGAVAEVIPSGQQPQADARDVPAAEAYARWLTRYEAVKATQTALARELEELCLPFEAKMDELVHRIEDVDAEARRINDAKPFAPDSDCRLLGNTESVVRASGLSTMKYLNLPAWEGTSRPASPPPWLLPLQIAASMGSRSAAEELDRAHRRALNQPPGLGG